jgi:DNA-binding CsgD family transcriptional regulator
MTGATPSGARVPLLERERELRAFEQRIGALRRGDPDAGACMLVHGEAGAGKTALVQTVRRCAGDDVLWLWGACEPLLAAGALMPLVDLLDQLPPSLAQAVRSGRATPEVLAGMLALLRDRARPAVLVIDDVQWADGATLDMVRFIGRRIATTRALLVLCWRDTGLTTDHPLRALLGSLPPRHMDRFALEPLSARAVAELARRAGRSAAGLHAATHGNPFFVTEWLAGDGQRLPEAVRDAVLARVAPLSDAARDILELVSVAPAGLEPDVIDSIVEGAEAALTECHSAALLHREAAVLRFRHELARQSVHGACDPARVASLHGAVFDALSLRGTPTARLVHHAEHAGLTAAVLRLAPFAAREATQAGAHRQAAAHLALALSHAETLDAARHAQLHVAHSRACMSIHRLPDALASRHAALAIHRRRGDTLAEGIDWREIARIEWFQGTVPAGQAHAARAIELLALQDAPRELALAQATQAQLHLFDADRLSVLEPGRRALDWFEAQRDDAGLCYALSIVASAELVRDDDSAAWHRLERSLAIAHRLGLTEIVTRVYAVLASMALVHRHFDRLHAACDTGIAYCDARDLDPDAARLHIRRAAGRIEQGDWSAARAELDGVRAIAGLAEVEDEQSIHILALLDMRCGVTLDADEWSERIAGRTRLSVDPWYAPQAPARVEAAWLRGDTQAATHIAAQALPEALRAGERWRTGALACWMRRAGAPVAIDPAQCALPRRLELTGDPRGAAQAWAALGCRYEQALALLFGDAPAVHEALAMLDALGAAPAARLARQKLRTLGVREVPRGRYAAARNDPQGLTARERAVFELLREGLSNRAIAQRLHRSERTVEHHVSALLAKLGAASRGELEK